MLFSVIAIVFEIRFHDCEGLNIPHYRMEVIQMYSINFHSRRFLQQYYRPMPIRDRDRQFGNCDMMVSIPGLIPGSRDYGFPIPKSRDWESGPGLQSLVISIGL
jgi:hypothetical protein